MKTVIYLERHGQSEGNVRGLIAGRLDVPLTEEGRMQARLTADALRHVSFSQIYSSDLSRAFYTAKEHADLRGVTVKTDKRLREIDMGDWDGLTPYEITEVRKCDFQKRFYFDFAYPEGETISGAVKRLIEALEEYAKENEGKTILAVAHSVVLRAFWFYISGYDGTYMHDKVKFMTNASYSIVEYERGVFTPIRYAVNDHLPDSEVKPF